MKMLTVSLLVCAVMALTAAAAVPEAEKTEAVTLSDQDAVSEAENNVTVALSDQDEENHLVKTSTCQIGWTEYYDCCYTYVSTPSTWAEAERNCIRQGGHLASVHSFEEQFEMQRMILKATYGFPVTWLGGYDAGQEGYWFWSDGTNFDFTYWDDGQPDGSGDCLVMNFGDNKKYDDQPCYYKKPYVCAIRSNICLTAENA